MNVLSSLIQPDERLQTCGLVTWFTALCSKMTPAEPALLLDSLLFCCREIELICMKCGLIPFHSLDCSDPQTRCVWLFVAVGNGIYRLCRILLSVGPIVSVVTDCISTGGNAVASVHLFPLYLRNQVTVDLELCMWVGPDHSSQGIEGQGHRSRLRSWIRLMRSVRLRRRARAVF